MQLPYASYPLEVPHANRPDLVGIVPVVIEQADIAPLHLIRPALQVQAIMVSSRAPPLLAPSLALSMATAQTPNSAQTSLAMLLLGPATPILCVERPRT